MAQPFSARPERQIIIRRKAGRGRPDNGAGPPIGLRLYSDIIVALDRWIETQPDPKPKRTEAIRELLRIALKVN